MNNDSQIHDRGLRQDADSKAGKVHQGGSGAENERVSADQDSVAGGGSTPAPTSDNNKPSNATAEPAAEGEDSRQAAGGPDDLGKQAEERESSDENEPIDSLVAGADRD